MNTVNIESSEIIKISSKLPTNSKNYDYNSHLTSLMNQSEEKDHKTAEFNVRLKII